MPIAYKNMKAFKQEDESLTEYRDRNASVLEDGMPTEYKDINPGE